MIELLVKNNSVVFVDSYDNSKYYEIEKFRFEETIHNNLSDWILQLDGKSWMKDNSYLLYQLASIICKEYPKNTIDWHTTFSVVEKGIYLDQLAEGQLPKEKSEMRNVLNLIKFNRDQSTPENHKIIDEIVTQNLKRYNLN